MFYLFVVLGNVDSFTMSPASKKYILSCFLEFLKEEYPGIPGKAPLIERLQTLMKNFEGLNHPTRKNFLNLKFVFRKIMQEHGFTEEFVSPFASVVVYLDDIPQRTNLENHEELYALIQ